MQRMKRAAGADTSPSLFTLGKKPERAQIASVERRAHRVAKASLAAIVTCIEQRLQAC